MTDAGWTAMSLRIMTANGASETSRDDSCWPNEVKSQDLKLPLRE
jgi:hypothetical protein